jgi:hypothetical protein
MYRLTANTLDRMLAWLSVAPFCRPVVPDVKRIAAGADGSISRARSWSG